MCLSGKFGARVERAVTFSRALAAVCSAPDRNIEQDLLCNMSEAVANAATAEAWADILAAPKYVDGRLATIQLLSAGLEGAVSDSIVFRLYQASTTRAAETAAPAESVAAAAVTFLLGLARMVVDRSKAEAVGWLLDQMGSELCGDESMMKPEQLEISMYWLPSVCALAHGTPSSFVTH